MMMIAARELKFPPKVFYSMRLERGSSHKYDLTSNPSSTPEADMSLVRYPA